MADVFEKLILEKGGKCGGTLGITRRADASLFATEREQPLASACIALQPCETRFDSAAVKVSGDDVIDEASPESEFLLESVLP